MFLNIETLRRDLSQHVSALVQGFVTRYVTKNFSIVHDTGFQNESEILNITSRHNDLVSQHETRSRTVQQLLGN